MLVQFVEADRLIYVFSGNRTNPYNFSSYPDYVDYRDRNEVFSDLIAYTAITLSLNSSDQADMISGVIVKIRCYWMPSVELTASREISSRPDNIFWNV